MRGDLSDYLNAAALDAGVEGAIRSHRLPGGPRGNGAWGEAHGYL